MSLPELEPILADAEDAYAGMCESYECGKWWAAASLATALENWIQANPVSTRKWRNKRLMNILTIRKESMRKLEHERELRKAT